jgi:predicted HTH transcriptional regulator
MLEITTLDDIASLRESFDVECKLAQGRDGQGQLSKDMWETYSAFANTQGGDIFLGLKENKDQSFQLAGITNTQKVLDDLWNNVNNSQKVSANLLREIWVKVIEIDGNNIIHIHVPQATRRQRPVFINGNPLKGTYQRLNSGDMVQDQAVVNSMLAEQGEESRDATILKGYGIEDLDVDSINAYRNIYSTREPDHPWNKVDMQTFLYQVGAWARDRENGVSGLTRAGLLMFGQYRPIMEAYPNYMVDYQERPEAKAEARWIDRIVPDGSWSGNVFDFYHKVIRKLTADLKVPFVLEGHQRQDDTLVHKALREALVNTLVHADYSGRASVLIVKRPDMFGFRNPGAMRISVEEAVLGGQSDCRNRTIQNLFRFIGLGENAGSGLPKIFDGWSSQHWRQPLLKEKFTPSEQTLLELHTLSLVPEKILNGLRDSLGDETFNGLSEHERLVLATAKIETTVDHRRMMSILDVHPKDLTSLFAGLVDKDLMRQSGSGRGTVYYLIEAGFKDFLTEVELLDSEDESDLINLEGLRVSSEGLSVNLEGLELGVVLKAELLQLAEPVSGTKKSSKQLVSNTILSLCSKAELSIEQLAGLLNRSVPVIRQDYVRPLIKEKKLFYRFPTNPSHPKQAYTTHHEDDR